MNITQDLLSWYDATKRQFSFRGTKDPYQIWVSEIMLQQTRTETAEKYFERFVLRFPTVESLAMAPEQEVLKLWEGLGYYSRARNLHKAAAMAARDGIPTSFEGLRALPGIGPYTAAAIASIAYDEPVPAMDGNLTRVISRLYHVQENVEVPSVKRRLFTLGQGLMPMTRAGDMNQALMDLGATVCTPGTPLCERCPLMRHCLAYEEGSPEQLPLTNPKKPPLEVEMGVAVLTCEGKALLTKRAGKLLMGLYVFPLFEGDRSADGVVKHLRHLKIRAEMKGHLKDARHVFTHRIWNMSIYHCETSAQTQVKDGFWADADEIGRLPLPTAVKVAKEECLRLICLNQ